MSAVRGKLRTNHWVSEREHSYLCVPTEWIERKESSVLSFFLSPFRTSRETCLHKNFATPFHCWSARWNAGFPEKCTHSDWVLEIVNDWTNYSSTDKTKVILLIVFKMMTASELLREIMTHPMSRSLTSFTSWHFTFRAYVRIVFCKSCMKPVRMPSSWYHQHRCQHWQTKKVNNFH